MRAQSGLAALACFLPCYAHHDLAHMRPVAQRRVSLRDIAEVELTIHDRMESVLRLELRDPDQMLSRVRGRTSRFQSGASRS